ncbi:MAG TPA: hypothetical protein VGG02_10395 [Chthoniobacterales bacterium]
MSRKQSARCKICESALFVRQSCLTNNRDSLGAGALYFSRHFGLIISCSPNFSR